MSLYYYDVYCELATLKQTFTYSSDQKLEPGIRVRVPFGKRHLTGLLVRRLHQKPEGFTIKPIEKVIDPIPILNQEQFDLADYLARRTFVSPMAMIQAMMPSLKKPKKVKLPKPETWLIKVQKEEAELDSLPMTEQQKAFYKNLPEKILQKTANKIYSGYMLKTMLKKGLIEKEQREPELIEKDVLNPIFPKQKQIEAPELSSQQKQAVESIWNSENPISLLYGVTGSGKTEVFLSLIEKALESGQVLVLVPERGLIPLMAQRLAQRLEAAMATFHGTMSPKRKDAIYNLVRENRIKLVVGTRSAVFLPFEKLSLIIMDEEHDPSYQSSRMPAYHARDVALKRIETHQARLVLASATPSLESYSRAYKGVYNLASLDKRFNESDNQIYIVDMKETRNYLGLSLPLLENISKRLKKKEKVILLLNRRGYLPIFQCQSCHEPMRCDECNIPLSYHKEHNQLVCHICGKHFALPKECPHCHSENWSQIGLGTERLEDELKEFFPQANIFRMDADTTRRKDAHEQILKAFEKEGDILLGTQMVAKGHDFEKVTLVGIVNIDHQLLRPDYRNNERAFALLEQAAGRAGRGNYPGQVIVQTYNPEHFVIQMLYQHQYVPFFRTEMRYRHVGDYPPYAYLAQIVLSGEDIDELYELAALSSQYFRMAEIHCFGPVEISMRKKQPRLRLLLKSRQEEDLIDQIQEYKEWIKNYQKKNMLTFVLNPMTIES